MQRLSFSESGFEQRQPPLQFRDTLKGILQRGDSEPPSGFIFFGCCLPAES